MSDTNSLVIDDNEAYRALLITEAHDCNHDFFEPKDTFTRKLTQKGGSAVVENKRKGTSERSINESKRKKIPTWRTTEGEVMYKNKGGDVWKEYVEGLLLSDKEIDELADDDWQSDFPLKKRIMIDIDDSFDIYDSIYENVIIKEYTKQYNLINSKKVNIPLKRGSTEARLSERNPKTRRIEQSDIFEMEQGGGGQRGGSRRTSRMGTQATKLSEKLKSEKDLYNGMLNKIKVWDMTVIQIKYPNTVATQDTLGDKEDIQEIRDINQQIQDEHGDECLYTFMEWVEKNKTNSKLLNQLIETNNHLMDVDKNIFFTQRIDERIKNVNNISGLTRLTKGLTATLIKFAKYTSVPEMLSIGGRTPQDVVVKFKIDVTMFIKKKWRKLDFDKLGTKTQTFFNKFFRKNKALMTDKDKIEVKKLRNAIMKYWMKFAYGATGPKKGEYQWIHEWTELIRQGGEITDIKLRDSFIKYEYQNKIKKGDRGIFYFKNPQEKVRQEDYQELQGISKEAYGNNAVGNNVAIDSHYIEKYNKPYPSKLHDWLFEDKKRYNCNYVNVADPGSTCPKWDCGTACEPFDITLKSKDGTVLMTTNMYPGAKANLSLGTFTYEINSLNGERPLVKKGFSLSGKGSGSEGLSKTNILDKVFEKMGGTGTYRERLYAFVKLLESDKNNEAIREVIQIFCLKLFGDFSQELFSVKQSYSKKTVFVGNDWISSIRYLFLQKHVSVEGVVQQSWWGGFMGGGDCFLMTNIMGLTAATKKTKKRKKKKKKKKHKTKPKRKSKRKNTKRRN